EPIRVSAGLSVTTLSGKMRIQTFPPRLRWCVIVRRAASICRAVIQAGSSVRMAYSPKAMVLPRSATPPRPPCVRLCILRCFMRFGCSMSVFPGGGRRWWRRRRRCRAHRWCGRLGCGGSSRWRFSRLALAAWPELARFLAWLEHTAAGVIDLGRPDGRGSLRRRRLRHFRAHGRARTTPVGAALLGGHLFGATTVGREVASIDPDLDSDHAVRGVRFGLPVVDVGAQRVQRYATPAVPFTTAHLRATQSARHLHANALGAEPLRALHGLLHRPPEGNPLLELVCDAARHEHGIDLGLSDLLNGDPDPLARLGFQRATQLLDFDAALADPDAWLRGADGDRDHVGRAFDLDLGHARVGHPGHDVLADAYVL